MKIPKPKKHPYDTFIEDAKNNAVSFYIIFKRGPNEVYTDECVTLDEALTIAETMNQQHGEYGRRAAIYAVDSKGHRDIIRAF